MELDTPKGTKDDLPEDKILLNKIMERIRETFEVYGYSPLDTPAIEKYDVLAAKYAGGGEILKETFKLTDQGKRKLALRYDLTVPLARVIGMRPDIKMPFKRYQMAKVWRDGPIGPGRFREFWQCDADVVGVKSMAADAEMLAIVSSALSGLGFKYFCKVNNRKLLNGIMSEAGIKKGKEKAILTLDKLDKIGEKGVREELKSFIKDEEADKVLELVSIKGSNDKVLKSLKSKIKSTEGQDGIQELKEMLDYSRSLGVAPRVDISLARGLAYYTGTIYEFFIEGSEIKNAVASGGRYDKMIGAFLGGREFPAVGVSIGVSRLYSAMQSEKKKTVTDVFVIPVGVTKEALEITQVLRQNNIKTDVDLLSRGPSKNLEYASSLGVPYTLFIGKKELEQGKVKLRDMRTGKEDLLTVAEVCDRLKS